MRARGMVIAVAFLLAMTATLAVFLYVKGVRDEAETVSADVSVIVSDQDIPAGTDLDELIADGAFTTVSVPEDAVVEGAVTDVADLQDQETSAAVLAGEQISVDRLRGVGELPGGSLGIPDGFEALTLDFQLPRAIAGNVDDGDHVTIYASFKPDVAGRHSTVVLVPDVLVLDAEGLGSDGAIGSDSVNTVGLVTMALTPADADDVIFAKEHGTVYLGLLPPGQKGGPHAPVFVNEVVRK